MVSRPISLAITAALLLAGACKERGERSFALEFPDACAAATWAEAYHIANVTCGASACEAVRACREDNCTAACPGLCPVEALRDGLAIEPPAAGFYAVVFRVGTATDAGVPVVLCAACAEVEVDSDGTGSSSATVVGEPCVPVP